MCGTRLRNGLLLLVGLLLLALPGYSWAKGSAEDNSAEPTERNPESSYEATGSEWNLILSETETLSTESARLRALAETLEAQRTELAKEVEGLKLLLKESGQQLEISYEEIERVNELLTRQKKDALSIGISTGIGLLVVGGLLGGLIYSAIPNSP